MHLLQLTAYNAWANRRIGQYLQAAGPTVADEPITSSFPTIRKTFYHLWDAQVIWHQRLRGVSANAWPSHGFTGTLTDAINAVNHSSDEFVRYCENLTENDARTDISFHALDGTAFHNTAEEIILHVVNHGTFHRGQIITMLRNAGFTAVGSTDLIRYYREVARKP